jgi:MoxR-like ATPase/tetratricopeptide (TPR) repeat protein
MSHDDWVRALPAIRWLLQEAFTAEELRRFLMDHEALRPIVTNLGPGDGLADMVDEVIDYCQKRVLFDELLAAVEEHNPRQYVRFAQSVGLAPAAPSIWLVSAPGDPTYWDDAFEAGRVEWTTAAEPDALATLRAHVASDDVVLAYRSAPEGFITGLGHIARGPYDYPGDRRAVEITMDRRFDEGVPLEELQQALPSLKDLASEDPPPLWQVSDEDWAPIRTLLLHHNPGLAPDDLPPSRVPAVHGPEIEEVELPDELLAGDPSVPVRLHLRNRGNVTWRRGERLHIVATWSPQTEGVDLVLPTWDWTVPLQEDLPPGAPLALEGLKGNVPALTGRCVIRLRVSGLDWGNDAEPASATLPVTVALSRPERDITREERGETPVQEHDITQEERADALQAALKDGEYERAVSLARSWPDPSLRASALTDAAKAMIEMGDLERAREALDLALAAASGIEDVGGRDWALHTVGQALVAAGAPSQAVSVTGEIGDRSLRRSVVLAVSRAFAAQGDEERAMEAAEATGDAGITTDVLLIVGEEAVDAGELDQGRGLLVRAGHVAQSIEPAAERAPALITVARTLSRAGARDRALATLAHAMKTAEEIENPQARSGALVEVGTILGKLDAVVQAMAPLESAFEAAQEIRVPKARVSAITAVGRAFAQVGAPEEAASALQGASKEAGQIPDRFDAVQALREVASALQAAGQSDRAAEVAGQAAQLLTEIAGSLERANALEVLAPFLTVEELTGFLFDPAFSVRKAALYGLYERREEEGLPDRVSRALATLEWWGETQVRDLVGHYQIRSEVGGWLQDLLDSAKRPPAHRAELEVVDPPQEVEASKSLEWCLRAVNTGEASWLPGERLALDAIWWPEGEDLTREARPFADRREFKLSEEHPPGSAVDLDVPVVVTAPVPPGRRHIEWRLSAPDWEDGAEPAAARVPVLVTPLSEETTAKPAPTGDTLNGLRVRDLLREGDLEDALRTAATIADPLRRVSALAELVGALIESGQGDRAAEVTDQALAALAEIDRKRDQAAALSQLAPFLPVEALVDALLDPGFYVRRAALLGLYGRRYEPGLEDRMRAAFAARPSELRPVRKLAGHPQIRAEAGDWLASLLEQPATPPALEPIEELISGDEGTRLQAVGTLHERARTGEIPEAELEATLAGRQAELAPVAALAAQPKLPDVQRAWLASHLPGDRGPGATELLEEPLTEAGARLEAPPPAQQVIWERFTRELRSRPPEVTTRTMEIHLGDRHAAAEERAAGDGRPPRFQVVLRVLERDGGGAQERFYEGPLRLDLRDNPPRGRVLGAALHRALFHDEMPDNRDRLLRGVPGQQTLKTGYVWALGRRARDDDLLRLQLRVNTATEELHGAMWEYLWDEQGIGEGPLACWDRTPFARRLHLSGDTDIESVPISAAKPLRILAATASPAELDLPDDQRQEACRGLAPITEPWLHDLVEGLRGRSPRLAPLQGQALLRQASLAAITRRLAEARDAGQPFHVLHLLCHGTVNRNDGRPYLVLEAEGKVRADLVSEEDLIRRLGEYLPGPEGSGLQLVVFASCLTALPGREQPLQGLARGLVAGTDLPAAVAMQDALEFMAAQHFSQELYAQLAHHGQIDRAVNAGRRKLWRKAETRDRYGGDLVGPRQWGVPVVFMRPLDGRLFVIEDQEDPTEADAEVQTTARPYDQSPGADPRRVFEAELGSAARRVDRSLGLGPAQSLWTGLASTGARPLVAEPPAGAPAAEERRRLFDDPDLRRARRRLVQAAADHRRSPNRRTILLLRRVACAEIAGLLSQGERFVLPGLHEFARRIAARGQVTWGEHPSPIVDLFAPHQLFAEREAARWHAAHLGFDPHTGEDPEEGRLGVQGNLHWPDEGVELDEARFAAFKEGLEPLLNGQGDPWTAFEELTRDDDPGVHKLLQRMASFLLQVVYPDQYVPYCDELASRVVGALSGLGLPAGEAAAYAAGFEGYCGLAADLLADEDLGLEDLGDVAFFLRRLARGEFARQGTPDVAADARVRLTPVRLQPRAVHTPLVLRRGVLPRAAAALNAGQHVILIGPPGTGKTTLSEDLARHAHDLNHNRGHMLVTATADWTTFDTIGGYMPESGDRLVFRPGLFLEAIAAQKWLVIDEINRADIDKAFGELFTVLSGQAVTLPYKVGGADPGPPGPGSAPVRILPPGHPTSGATFDYPIHPSWRIIGTMNVYDKASLFAMSYAFMRRFAFIDVAVPRAEPFRRLIQHFLWSAGLLPAGQRYAQLQEGIFLDLFDLFNRDDPANHLMKWRALGPAIALDVVRYLRHRTGGQAGALTPGHLAEALAIYAAPQFDGLQQESILAIHGQLKTRFGHAALQQRCLDLRLRRASALEEFLESDRLELAEKEELLACVEMLLARIEELFPYIAAEAWRGSGR